MKTRLAVLCLPVLFVFLAACRGRFVPSASAPPARPESSAPPAESQAPPAESESQPPMLSSAEYSAMVSAFHARIMEESELLIRAGLYEYNWWGSSSEEPDEVDLDAMVELAMEWLSENLDADADRIAAAYHELITLYAVLTYADVDGAVPAELPALAEALFAAYSQLYRMVTEPSGTVHDFADTLCSCMYSITTSGADLARLLPAGGAQGL